MADGLEGRRAKMSALLVRGGGGKGGPTSQKPTQGIPSPHHSPGPALSVDSAAALTPIIDGVGKAPKLG
jgi:hypothetical protein